MWITNTGVAVVPLTDVSSIMCTSYFLLQIISLKPYLRLIISVNFIKLLH